MSAFETSIHSVVIDFMYRTIINPLVVEICVIVHSYQASDTSEVIKAIAKNDGGFCNMCTMKI